jgi:hypothetical protein
MKRKFMIAAASCMILLAGQAWADCTIRQQLENLQVDDQISLQVKDIADFDPHSMMRRAYSTYGFREVTADDSTQQYVVEQFINSIPHAKDHYSLNQEIDGIRLKPLTPDDDTRIFWYIDIPSCRICQFEDGSPTFEIEALTVLPSGS